MGLLVEDCIEKLNSKHIKMLILVEEWGKVTLELLDRYKCKWYFLKVNMYVCEEVFI